MNFLAHFYLAYGNAHQLVGQFIADAVKGKVFDQYPKDVQEGIRLHRMIDSLTDTNEVLSELRAVIRPHTGLLSPIVLDLLMDHQLAKQWTSYHSLELNEFALLTYSELRKYEAMMPERMIIALNYMEKYDWLSNYVSKEGLTKSITGLSRRVTNGEKMLAIIPFLEEIDIHCDMAFKQLFPALANSVKPQLTSVEPSYLTINHYFL